MSVKKLYRGAVRKGRRWLKRLVPIDVVRTNLREMGLSKIDIETAINLMACTLYFDGMIFPEKKIEHCSFCREGPDSALMAYNHPDSKKYPFEAYQVRVSDLQKDIKSYLTRVVLIDQNGIPTEKMYRDYPAATCKEKILAIAAHEVRHRLQKNGIKRFEIDKVYTDRQIDGHVYHLRVLFEDGGEPSYSCIEDDVLRGNEFDARVIENISLWLLHEGGNAEKICGAIKTEGVVVE